MNQKLADVREKAQRKEELLAQLTARLAAANAERLESALFLSRLEKDKLKNRLHNKLSIRMGLKAPTETLRIQYDRTNLFLSRTPSEGIHLLVRELQELEQTLTQEKQVQALQVQIIPVQFGEDVCRIRNTRPSYTFEELCYDAAVYFNQDPTDCVLRDESAALWPGKAKVKDELAVPEEGRGIILAPKHQRVTKDRYTKQDALNWQEVAAHSKLETRLREMQKFRVEKKGRDRAKSRMGKKHGILRGVCGFLWYLGFLVQLIFVIMSQVSITDSFRLNSGLTEVFLTESFPLNSAVENGLTIQFPDITTSSDFYNWAFGVLVPGLFSSIDESIGTEVLTLKYNQVGGIRFRQVRVRSNSCSVFNYHSGGVYDKDEIHCYAGYTESAKSTEAFSIGKEQCADQTQSCRLRQAFRYTSDIPNSSSVSGVLGDYGVTGFYIDSEVFLDDNKLTQSDLTTMLQFLQTNNWIDLQTRAVIITFITWNMNYEYFTQVQFTIEFGATSVVYPRYSIDTFNIIPLMSSWLRITDSFGEFMQKFPELYVFLYSWVGIFLPTAVRFAKGPKAFFSVMWNIIDLLLFFLMQGQIIARVYLYFVADDINTTLNKRNFNVFLNLNTPLLAISILGNMESYAILLAALKLLSYFQLSSMTMIWDTLERGMRSIFAFMIILVLLLNAFTQMDHIVYGSAVESFSTFPRSLISLFRMLLGDISRYPAMSDAEPNFTPFIFIGYIFLCFFVMLNIFVAILNEAFGVVVDYRQQNKDAARMQKFGKKVVEELTFYWRRLYYRLRDCWKRSKQTSMSKTLRKLRN